MPASFSVPVRAPRHWTLSLLATLSLSAHAGEGDPAPPQTTLPTLHVTSDWLGPAASDDSFDHPGARDIATRTDFLRTGATTAREALNRIPGVSAPDNNGTGSHDLALNVGVRGLNSRLASRSTVLMDGIPVPYAPYGQPQLSLAPLSLGNMQAVDVVRGGGAVRYGPQNVGGIINFVTRAIPQAPTAQAAMQWQASPASAPEGPRRTANALLGGTGSNGLGAALLYSGTRGGDYRQHSDTRIDDVMLKAQYQPDAAHRVHAIAQYYDGQAQMPGGLSQAAYAADPFQSTRPLDRFWGRRTLLGAGYDYEDAGQEFSANAYFTKTLRSSVLDQSKFVSSSPRYYWVRGVEARYGRNWEWGAASHRIGAGWRYLDESSHELRYRAPPGGALPGPSSRNDRDTRGQTRANALYLDDRIDIGDWTITPGLRYEFISQSQRNLITSRPYQARYRVPLPALHVLYRLNPGWNVYANTETSFGSVQYSQMPNRVAVDQIKPEKARTWELGTHYESGGISAALGAFLVNFNNQYESSQTTERVIARGRTRHRGIEGRLAWELGQWSPTLEGLDVRVNYAYVDARIRERGENYDNRVPFSSRHKGLAAMGYGRGPLRLDLELQAQSAQYADNANTRVASADGSTGRIPGYGLWNLRANYELQSVRGARVGVGVGVMNLFDRRYFTRSYNDVNRGMYVGQPRTPYVQIALDM
ncbi:MAG TPA: TonB-dependent siderophore receptor [Stenotrophomonas sp.]|nr:TonB-dependent siderophore receptor [Stenotrophomonas sp.]